MGNCYATTPGLRPLSIWKRTAKSIALSVVCWRFITVVLLVAGGHAAHAADVTCSGGFLQIQPLVAPAPQPDLLVRGGCSVQTGPGTSDYYYGNVNILDGGSLNFTDQGGTPIEFWASAIIIERNGALTAKASGGSKPFGTNGGRLTIHLYGKDESKWNPAQQKFDKQNVGARCRTEEIEQGSTGPCGILPDTWENGQSAKKSLPGLLEPDYFYKYGPLYGDGRCSDDSVFDNKKGFCVDGSGNQTSGKVGYFGNKVL